LGRTFYLVVTFSPSSCADALHLTTMGIKAEKQMRKERERIHSVILLLANMMDESAAWEFLDLHSPIAARSQKLLWEKKRGGGGGGVDSGIGRERARGGDMNTVATKRTI
jgi:hypothetical protein